MTTRPPGDGEVGGVDYCFVAREVFLQSGQEFCSVLNMQVILMAYF